MREKWSKEKVRQQLLKIKSTDGIVNSSHVRKRYPTLHNAIIRLFVNHTNALIFSGFDPAQEKGDTAGFRGKHHTAESKHKLSEAHRGKYAGYLNPMYGKSHTEKTKQIISEKTKQWRCLHPEFQSGDKNPMFGKHQSDESNAKRSQSLLQYHSQFDKRPYCLTEDGRKRIQAGRARAIANQKSQETDIEQKMSLLLDDLGLEYERQISFQYFVVDFFLPRHNLVIWCDGDYWHANPRQCINLTKRQRTQQRLDRSQESFLANRGVCYVRFWGTNIKHDANKCKQIIWDKINNQEMN
jgi:very-short-patch-repair endonuclease